MSALYGDMLDAEYEPEPNKVSMPSSKSSRRVVTQGTVFKRIGPSEGLLS